MNPACILHGHSPDVMRKDVKPRSVDMVYADPPFFTQRDWTGAAGSFTDRWAWDTNAKARWQSLECTQPRAASILRSITCGRKDLLSYLLAMKELLAAAHRCLKSTGSLWLHCDDTASAYLRGVCDQVFGLGRYWGTVIWKRSEGQNTTTKSFGRNHDSIHVYVRSGAAILRLAHRGFSIPVLCEIDGCRAGRISGFADDTLSSQAAERVGYPTQKPTSLLRKLIEAGSNPGDLILDPCCGSGTTIVAAQELGRSAIGLDASIDAVAMTRKRTTKVSFQMDLFGEATA